MLATVGQQSRWLCRVRVGVMSNSREVKVGDDQEEEGASDEDVIIVLVNQLMMSIFVALDVKTHLADVRKSCWASFGDADVDDEVRSCC